MNGKDVYDYIKTLEFPYNYEVDFEVWKKSYLEDTDGEGRVLFSELATLGAYAENKLVGFVQYGKTAFGFDESGEISDNISYPVIRTLYYDENADEAGKALLGEAVKALSDWGEKIYAFFHYFGMSCCARHGKLFEGFEYIHNMLTENGFELEHENVFYSSELSSVEETEVAIKWQDMTKGSQQYCDFMVENEQVGGCEVHFMPQEGMAYLRWIYINQDICSKGIGTKCMKALKSDLYNKGIVRFDTDTALVNTVAQHFYEKNNFVREGITRSYFNVF